VDSEGFVERNGSWKDGVFFEDAGVSVKCMTGWRGVELLFFVAHWSKSSLLRSRWLLLLIFEQKYWDSNYSLKNIGCGIQELLKMTFAGGIEDEGGYDRVAR
jgi:hypothetical protein